MDEDRARDFWERALRDIDDDGFFAPVRTAEPVVAQPAPLPHRQPAGRRLTNVQMVLMVVLLSLLLVLVVVYGLTPALFR